jgi:hypothetical protein
MGQKRLIKFGMVRQKPILTMLLELNTLLARQKDDDFTDAKTLATTTTVQSCDSA